jgi:HSP20 family protein
MDEGNIDGSGKGGAKMKDLVPWARTRPPVQADETSPFLSLHREMNRLFDEAFRGFGTFRDWPERLSWPAVEISEGDKEICVTADLPGLELKDIELGIENDVLTIRGEKRSEVEDKDRRYSERSYGRFERRLALPSEVDEDRSKATFRNGVLTVVLPKTERARQRGRRIAITDV